MNKEIIEIALHDEQYSILISIIVLSGIVLSNNRRPDVSIFFCDF